jgi:fibronectin type 3 domain-containing protein
VGTRSLTAEATPEGPLLGWTAPPATPSKPAPATYKVWRRARGEAAFTLLAEVAALSYVDPAVISGPDYEYTVTFDRP